MSPTVEDQLRDYFSFVDEIQGAVDVDRIVADAPPQLQVLDVESDRTDTAADGGSPAGSRPHHGRPPTRRLVLVAAALAAVALAAGLVLAGTRRDEPAGPVDEPPPTAVTIPPVDTPVPLPLWFGEDIEPGRYTTPLLGMDATFDLPDGWWVIGAQIGDVTLGSEDPLGPGTRSFTLARVGGWYTPDEAADPEFTDGGSIAPYAIDEFLDANRLVHRQLPSTVVAGRPAKVHEWELDPETNVRFSCTPDRVPCVYTFSVSPESFDPQRARDPERAFPVGLSARSYVLVIDGHDPVVVIAWHWSDGDEDPVDRGAWRDAWFDEFETTILPSLELGPDGPPLDRI